MYSGYGIAFDGKCSWSFGNVFAKNVVVFGVDNSSSSHTDNCKNNCFVLGEGDTFGIHGSFRAPEKSLVLILVKQKQNFASVCTTFVIKVICLLTEKKSINLKLLKKMSTFQLNFVLEKHLIYLTMLRQ